jgi:hypothetical protein
LERFLVDARLPSPWVQALNAIRFIGDHASATGERLPNLQPSLCAVIGAPNPRRAGELAVELYNEGLITGNVHKPLAAALDVLDATLTLTGWGKYEEERRAKVSGPFGFLAMEFGESALEAFVSETVKPCVKQGIGYDLFDARDRTRAGIIDNLLRAHIRDSAFVIVDLTHDNSGAYWEAGYAEGVGKPVIYICEKDKFDRLKTHFDTSHSTTVVWDKNDPQLFERELVATLRRSLNLFPNG